MTEATAAPKHSDGDDDGDDEGMHAPTLDVQNEICTWSDDQDEQRRAFVVDLMADSNIAGYILVENMDAVCQWLKTGTVPKRSSNNKVVTKATG